MGVDIRPIKMIKKCMGNKNKENEPIGAALDKLLEGKKDALLCREPDREALEAYMEMFNWWDERRRVIQLPKGVKDFLSKIRR